MPKEWWRRLNNMDTCKHSLTVIETRGRQWFSQTGPEDNLTDHLICMNCGADLNEIDEKETQAQAG